jgi:hypothetical protein
MILPRRDRHQRRRGFVLVPALLLPAVTTTTPLLVANESDGRLPIIAYSIVIVTLCVLIHFQALQLLVVLLRRLKRLTHLSIVLVIVSLLIVHLIEINIFAIGYRLLDERWEASRLVGDFPGGYVDYAYFSAVVYTTLGFGDLVPVGAMRTLTAFEALTGLLLVAWSASFTFLVMQTRWKPDSD